VVRALRAVRNGKGQGKRGGQASPGTTLATRMVGACSGDGGVGSGGGGGGVSDRDEAPEGCEGGGVRGGGVDVGGGGGMSSTSSAPAPAPAPAVVTAAAAASPSASAAAASCEQLMSSSAAARAAPARDADTRTPLELREVPERCDEARDAGRMLPTPPTPSEMNETRQNGAFPLLLRQSTSHFGGQRIFVFRNLCWQL